MKPRSRSHAESGVTLIEGLVIIAVVVVLGALLLPFPRTGNKMEISLHACRNNLKRIGLAENMWAQDHETNFPAQLSTNQGGTREHLLAGRVDLHFRPLVEYTGSSLIFHCPADSRAAPADTATFGNTNISYFASLDASPLIPNAVVGGDRNLTFNSKTSSSGFATLNSNSMLGWSGEMHTKIIKKNVGVLLFADGHAEVAYEQRLPALTASMGAATNRLVFP